MAKSGKKRETKLKKEKRESEEKTKKLEAEQEKESASREVKGVTKNVLKGLSSVFPGLGGLIKGLEKSEAFQERVKEIDKEVEKRVKETPLRKTSAVRTPQVKGEFGIKPNIKRGKEILRDIPVDIFDEHNHIDVIAEIPGMEEKDIKMDLNADTLTISAGKMKLKYFKKLRLPCKPKGITRKLYKNGIMEITLAKE